MVRTWSYISPSKTLLACASGTMALTALLLSTGAIAGKPDVVVSYSPPLPLGLSALMLSRLWRVPWVLELEDLYPDAAVAAGVLSNRSAIAFFAGMERCFSTGMRPVCR